MTEEYYNKALPANRLYHHHYHTHHPHQLKLSNIPWSKMFSNKGSLALLITAFAQGWVGLMILIEMPAFLHQQLGDFLHHYLLIYGLIDRIL